MKTTSTLVLSWHSRLLRIVCQFWLLPTLLLCGALSGVAQTAIYPPACDASFCSKSCVQNVVCHGNLDQLRKQSGTHPFAMQNFADFQLSWINGTSANLTPTFNSVLPSGTFNSPDMHRWKPSNPGPGWWNSTSYHNFLTQSVCGLGGAFANPGSYNGNVNTNERFVGMRCAAGGKQEGIVLPLCTTIPAGTNVTVTLQAVAGDTGTQTAEAGLIVAGVQDLSAHTIQHTPTQWISNSVNVGWQQYSFNFTTFEPTNYLIVNSKIYSFPNGCAYVWVDQVELISPTLFVSVTSPPFNCNTLTGSATANPVGGTPAYSYNWSNGATTQTIMGVPQNNYTVTVTVTDMNGCTAVGTVGVEPRITFQITEVPTCGNQCFGSLTAHSAVNAQLPIVQYSINGGSTWQTSATFNNLCAGSYSITIEDSYGCTATQGATVVSISDPWPKHPVTMGTESAIGRGVEQYGGGHFLCGNFTESILFEHLMDPSQNVTLSNNNTSNPESDAFIARYDDCGIDWAFGFGCTALSGLDHAAVVRGSHFDADDYIVVGVNIHGNIPGGIQGASGSAILNPVNNGLVNFSSTMSSGIEKGLILKVNASSGAVQWVYMIGDDPNEPSHINDLRISLSGDIYAIGNFNSTLTFGAGANIQFPNGPQDIFLCRIDNSGGFTPGSAVSWGSFGTDFGMALDLMDGTDGEVFTTGSVDYQTVNWPTGPPTAAGTFIDAQDVYVSRHSMGANLSLYASRVYRSDGEDRGMDIVAPLSLTTGEAYYITGFYNDALLISVASGAPQTANPTAGYQNAFVAGIDLANDRLWVEDGGGNTPGAMNMGDALVRHDTVLYNIGTYATTNLITPPIGFLGGYIFANGTNGTSDNDIYVASLGRTAGLSLNAHQLQGNGNIDGGHDIEEMADDLYITGTFGGSSIFFPGQGPIPTNSNTQDVFMARLTTGLFFFKQGQAAAIVEEPEEPVSANQLVEDQIEVYPNPTNGQFTVEWMDAKVTRLELRDMTGRVIAQRAVSPGMQNAQLNLSAYPTGFYFLMVIQEGKMDVKKIVRQ